jgi:hypothetical protein
MTVNGWKLPDSLVALIDRPEPVYWWVPKGGNQRWVYRGGEGGMYWVPEGTPGRHEWLDVLMLYKSQTEIEEATVMLADNFHIDEYTAEDIGRWNADWSNQPGYYPLHHGLFSDRALWRGGRCGGLLLWPSGQPQRAQRHPLERCLLAPVCSELRHFHKLV